MFLGFVLEYSINAPEHAHRMREAVYKTIYDEPVDDTQFTIQTAKSMQDELEALEKRLREGVE